MGEAYDDEWVFSTLSQAVRDGEAWTPERAEAGISPTVQGPLSGSGTVGGASIVSAVKRIQALRGTEPGIIEIKGWKIGGDLDFSSLIVQEALVFRNCRMAVFRAQGSRLYDLRLDMCDVGDIRLNGARFENDLMLRQCVVATLWMEAMTVEGNLTVEDCQVQTKGFAAGGRYERRVVWKDIQLGDGLDMSDCSFGSSVSMERLASNGGAISFDNAVVAGNLGFFGCALQKTELALGSMSVAHRLDLRETVSPPEKLFLTGSRVETFKDDRAAWPSRGHLHLDRFTYDRLSAENTMSRHVAWLMRQPADHLKGKNFRVQPWRQLIDFLKRRGSLEFARKLAIRQKDTMLGAGAHGWWISIVNFFLSVTCRYGLQPWLPVAWYGALVLASGFVFQKADMLGCIQAKAGAVTVPDAFNPLLYSLDLALPAIDLGQGDYYHAVSAGAGTAWYATLVPYLPLYIAAHTLICWLLLSIIVLSFSGFVEKRLAVD